MNEWSERDRQAIFFLSHCTFLPGSYNKRFVRSLNTMAVRNDPMIDKQLVNLWRLVWRYRRQHQERELIDLAYTMMAIHQVACFLWDWFGGDGQPGLPYARKERPIRSEQLELFGGKEQP